MLKALGMARFLVNGLKTVRAMPFINGIARICRYRRKTFPENAHAFFFPQKTFQECRDKVAVRDGEESRKQAEGAAGAAVLGDLRFIRGVGHAGGGLAVGIRGVGVVGVCGVLSPVEASFACGVVCFGVWGGLVCGGQGVCPGSA